MTVMTSPAPFDIGSLQLPANLPGPLVMEFRAATNDRERAQALINLDPADMRAWK